jgi:pilus assembly protein CpaB
MKMKSLILIFIALGCGLVATIGISQVMDRNSGSDAPIPMEQILVAKADIDIGKALDANSVQLEEWPAARVPEGALRSLDEVAEKFPQTRFYKGEPILQAKISDENGSAMDKIPDGYRTATIKVEADTVMEGIGPGDRVDVLVILKQGGEIRQTGAFPILKNVRVFSKGSQTERTVDNKNQQVRSQTISLLVKPDQGLEIALADEMGKIRLALRNPSDDPADDKDVAVPLSELLSGKSSDGDKKEGAANSEALSGAFTKPPVPVLAPPAMELAKGPIFSMLVQSPNEFKSYQWAEGESLPTETTVLSVGAAGQPLPPITAPPSPQETVEDDSTDSAADTQDSP